MCVPWICQRARRRSTVELLGLAAILGTLLAHFCWRCVRLASLNLVTPIVDAAFFWRGGCIGMVARSIRCPKASTFSVLGLHGVGVWDGEANDSVNEFIGRVPFPRMRPPSWPPRTTMTGERRTKTSLPMMELRMAQVALQPRVLLKSVQRQRWRHRRRRRASRRIESSSSRMLMLLRRSVDPHGIWFRIS